MGNPLDIISSGPTYPDQSTPQDCLHIFSSLNVYHSLPRAVIRCIEVQEKRHTDSFHAYEHVHNVIIGSNQLALMECKKKALQLGYHAVVVSSDVEGEARTVGRAFGTLCASLVHKNYQSAYAVADILGCEKQTLIPLLQQEDKPICLIAGGETTVYVQHNGRGGRNQELALSAAIALHELLGPSDFNRCVILSAGTDGQDGPTPAAGAYGIACIIKQAQEQYLDPAHFLNQNDSHSFYSKVRHGEYSLLTGITGTNVMDIQVALVDVKGRSA